MSDRFEALERARADLKFRVTVLFIFFVVSIFSVFVITSAMEVNTVIRFIGSRLAIPTVRQAQTVIDGDAFEKLRDSLDQEDPYYEAARIRLLDLKERSGSVYLYTMAPVDGRTYRFIIDGSAPPGDQDNFSPLGTLEDTSEYEDVFFDVMREKEIVLGSIDQNETWGKLISAYGPILNANGEAVGVIGCDLEAASIAAWIRGRVAWQMGIIAVFLIVGLAVYFMFLRRLDRLEALR
ncbi:MAG: hypothetical protein LBD31_11085 [Treponema sp.]|jgi:methyl-accepting chemotaxis protein|nr:hypothetical protein [Treponema sp.]